jgi:hypothetical protein
MITKKKAYTGGSEETLKRSIIESHSAPKIHKQHVSKEMIYVYEQMMNKN